MQKFDQLHLWIQNQVSRCTPKPLSVCCFSDRCLRDFVYFGRSYHVFPLGFLSSETNFSRHWFLKKYISKWLCKKNRNEYTSWEQAWTTSLRHFYSNGRLVQINLSVVLPCPKSVCYWGHIISILQHVKYEINETSIIESATFLKEILKVAITLSLYFTAVNNISAPEITSTCTNLLSLYWNVPQTYQWFSDYSIGYKVIHEIFYDWYRSYDVRIYGHLKGQIIRIQSTGSINWEQIPNMSICVVTNLSDYLRRVCAANAI